MQSVFLHSTSKQICHNRPYKSHNGGCWHRQVILSEHSAVLFTNDALTHRDCKFWKLCRALVLITFFDLLLLENVFLPNPERLSALAITLVLREMISCPFGTKQLWRSRDPDHLSLSFKPLLRCRYLVFWGQQTHTVEVVLDFCLKYLNRKSSIEECISVFTIS